MWNNPLPASSRIGVLPHITVSRETRMTHATRQEIDALRARAEAGVASAQFSLGFRYNTGQGVPQDYVEAHMWYNLAASLRLTGEFGVRNRDRVAGRMTPDQIAEAQRRAREWTPTPEP